jgi:RNA polymerase sigma-70 factor (ECF subfamily)
MTLTSCPHHHILKAVPRLRAFAISLTGNIDQADDLVQDALMRGLSNIERFEPGTNMQAWLFTILRNLFLMECRRRKREVEDPDGMMASRLSVHPAQDGYIDVEDLKVALTRLPVKQREALLLVAAQAFLTRRLLRLAERRLGRSKAGSSVPEPDWLNCLRSRSLYTSEQTASSRRVCISKKALAACGLTLLGCAVALAQS